MIIVALFFINIVCLIRFQETKFCAFPYPPYRLSERAPHTHLLKSSRISDKIVVFTTKYPHNVFVSLTTPEFASGAPLTLSPALI